MVIEKMNYDIKNKDNVSSEIEPLLEAAKKAYGFVPNLLGTMANSALILKNYWNGSLAIAEHCTLTAQEQQIAFLSANYENNCTYCMAAHTTVSQNLKIEESTLSALRNGTKILDEKLEALSQYVKATTIKRGRVSQGDIDEFLKAGYTQENILEVITIVSVKVMSNYVNYIAGTPLDTAFKRNAWEK